MSVINWMVEKPFPGYSQTSTYIDDDGVEKVAFSSLSPSEYLKENPKLSMISDDELTKVMGTYESSMITLPVKITKERYFEMLEILPPCRWHTEGYIEYFHMSERIYGRMTDWFVNYGEDYYNFVDRDNITETNIIGKVVKSGRTGS